MSSAHLCGRAVPGRCECGNRTAANASQRVTQSMGRCRFIDAGKLNVLTHSALQILRIGMVPSFASAAGIDAQLVRWQHVLPTSITCRLGIFSRQGKRQKYLAKPLLAIAFVKKTHPRQMVAQWEHQQSRQHRDPVLGDLTSRMRISLRENSTSFNRNRSISMMRIPVP